MTNKIKQLNLDENFNINSAAEEIKKNGVVIINNFISNEDSNEIKKLLEGPQLRNSNELTYIHLNDAKFFSNAVAQSRAAYNLVTSKIALSLAKKYLGENIRLKCHRAYTTKKQFFFPWHTDNKFNDQKNNKKGIVFIIYLVDTKDGATEFVLGSHEESHLYKNNLFPENQINEKYKERIAIATGEIGCAVISDTRTIHRGSVAKGKIINRQSFWFQIDFDTNQAERLLLNPEFLPQIIPNELSEYLGFSKRFGLDVHPVTTNNDKVLPFNIRVNLMFKYLALTLLTPLHWIRIKIPIKFKNLLKKIGNVKSDWN